jgi:ASC-1-like (ASCH) protein
MCKSSPHRMEMHLDSVYFDYILDRTKIYEIRVYDRKRRKIRLLDTIKFYDRGSERTLDAVITELSYFNNFYGAIEEVGVKKVLPNARSTKDAVSTYEKFPHEEGNYKKGAEKYGILRMRFEVV